MKKHALHFLTLFCLLVTVSVGILIFFPTKEDMELYSGFIRLHVVANSDSDEDQALKLKVRDAVLPAVAEMLADCADVEDAKLVLSRNSGLLVQTAAQVVGNEGVGQSVSVHLGQEYYPTRGYDGLRLPAGTYESLRIVIGEGAGHNWWCVLFPPLCVNTAAPENQLIEAGFTGSQVKILTECENPRYVLKFRILEWISSLGEH